METQKVAFSNADVSGTFEDISGTIVFDPANLASAKFNFKLKSGCAQCPSNVHRVEFCADVVAASELAAWNLSVSSTGFK